MKSQQQIPEGVHLPAPSYYPLGVAIGMVILAAGIIWTPIVAAIGLVALMAAIVGWTQENRARAHEEDDHGG